MSTRYAVHTHIGVYWDGGVRLLAIHRWFLTARIHCWWHARVTNPMRVSTVVPVRAGARLDHYHNCESDWRRAMNEAGPRHRTIDPSAK